MTIKNNKNNKDYSDSFMDLSAFNIDDLEITNSELIAYPEESILLDLDINLNSWDMVLESLKICMVDRNYQENVKIKKISKSIIQVNDFIVQIVICGLSSDEVNVPLNKWKKSGKAPQLILPAKIDHESNIIYFPGTITSSKFISLIPKKISNEKNLTLNINNFYGGIDKFFNYVTLFNSKAISREGINLDSGKNYLFAKVNKKFSFFIFIFLTILSFLVYGNKGLNFKYATDIDEDSSEMYISKIEASKKINGDINKVQKSRSNEVLESFSKSEGEISDSKITNINKDESYKSFKKIDNITISKIDRTDFNTKKLSFKNKCFDNQSSEKAIIVRTYDLLEKSNFIELSELPCSTTNEINKFAYKKLLITTSRKNQKPILCITDNKEIPCKVPIGVVKNNISPTLVLSKIASNYGYELPKPKFLNETNERLFINIYNLLSKEYDDLDSLIQVINK